MPKSRLLFLIPLLISVFWIFRTASFVDKQSDSSSQSSSLSSIQLLGKKLFFDPTLSNPEGLSCSSCHSPNRGFSDPENLPVSRGAIKSSFGNRNAPSLAYAAYAPVFHYDSVEETYVGGLFWDGRAKDLSEQVKGPIFNHLEMNNKDKKMLVNKVRNGPCKALLLRVYGNKFFQNDDFAFEGIIQAIVSYEGTNEVNPFTSKYDYYLRGKVKLTETELLGLEVFKNPKKGNCAACHPSEPDKNKMPLFTDFTYDNLGLPVKKGMLGLNSSLELDEGLGQTVKKIAEIGKFKVPTLRNVAITAPYFHNGIFYSLEEAVRFYNERDSGKFGKPEVESTMNREELGNLKLTEQEIKALVVFLNTLTDGYKDTLNFRNSQLSK